MPIRVPVRAQLLQARFVVLNQRPGQARCVCEQHEGFCISAVPLDAGTHALEEACVTVLGQVIAQHSMLIAFVVIDIGVACGSGNVWHD